MGLWNYLLTNQPALFPFQNENKKRQREDQEIEKNNITKTTYDHLVRIAEIRTLTKSAFQALFIYYLNVRKYTTDI